jgi:hypothetical protein
VSTKGARVDVWRTSSGLGYPTQSGAGERRAARAPGWPGAFRGPPLHLDPATTEFYHEKGAALQRGAFTPEQLEILTRGVAKNRENPSKASYRSFEDEDWQGAFQYDYGCHSRVPEYAEFVETSGLAEAVAGLLSSQRLCSFDEGYFVKQAGCAVPAPWHHDFSYYQIEGDFAVAWVPLDPHGEQETLRMVAGSHRWGREFTSAAFDPNYPFAADASASRSIAAIPDIDAGEYEILAWEVEHGDCVLFNGLTLHASRGNPTQRDQRRFSCRFIDEGATYVPRGGDSRGIGARGVGIDDSTLQPGQCVSEDSRSFPVVWQADSTKP